MVFHTRQVWFLVPGCFAKQPGKVSCSVPFLPPFFCLFILTIYLGSLAATRSSQGGQRSAALSGRGFRSLAALRSSQGRFAVPFPSPLFFLFIDTNYILRVPGCYAKQPGWSTVCRAWARFSVPGCSRGSQGGSLWCSTLGRRGFWSLAALQSCQERFPVPFPSPLLSCVY